MSRGRPPLARAGDDERGGRRAGPDGSRNEVIAASYARVVTDDVPSICIGCGLCCDGTVLGHLAVADESDLGWPLRSLGVELIVAADPPVFELPCPAVVDGRCTVYELHRPRACGRYVCDLWRAHDLGRVTRADALATIAATAAQRDRVRAGIEPPASLHALVRAHFRASPAEP